MPIQGIRCSVPFCGSVEEQTRTSCVLRSLAVVLGIIVLLAGVLALSGIPGVHALGVAGGSVLTFVGAALVLAGLFFWYPKKGVGPGEETDIRNANKKSGQTLSEIEGNKEKSKSSAEVDPLLRPFKMFYHESQSFKILVGRVLEGEKDARGLLLERAKSLREIILAPPQGCPAALEDLHDKIFGDTPLVARLDEIINYLECLQGYKDVNVNNNTEEKLRQACEQAKALVEQFKEEEFVLSIENANKNLEQARNEIKNNKGNSKNSTKADPKLLPYQKFYYESQSFKNEVEQVLNGNKTAENLLLSHASELRNMMLRPSPDESPKYKLKEKTFNNISLLDLLDRIIPILADYRNGVRNAGEKEKLFEACKKAKALVEQFTAEEFGIIK